MTQQKKSGVSAALEFIEKIAAAEKLHNEVSELINHQEVETFAATLGYEVTKKDLDEAMKTFLDRSLEQDGIPVWVRKRVQVTVHD